MRRVLTVAMMAVASVPAALILFLGFVAIEVAHTYRRRRTPFGRIKVTREQRRQFALELQELEFRVMNVGPTIIGRKRP